MSFATFDSEGQYPSTPALLANADVDITGLYELLVTNQEQWILTAIGLYLNIGGSGLVTIEIYVDKGDPQPMIIFSGEAQAGVFVGYYPVSNPFTSYFLPLGADWVVKCSCGVPVGATGTFNISLWGLRMPVFQG